MKTHQHIILPDDPEKVPKWLYLDLEFVRSGSKVGAFPLSLALVSVLLSFVSVYLLLSLLYFVSVRAGGGGSH